MPRKMLKNYDGECIMCGKDISHKKITALYCDNCKKIASRRSYRESKRNKRGYYNDKKCSICGKIIKRATNIKYWRDGFCSSKCKINKLKLDEKEKKRSQRDYYSPKKCKNCNRKIERTQKLKYWAGYCDKCK